MNASSMRAAATRALLATTCLSTFLIASPALAQNADVPSAYKNIDENGVDLTDGSFNFTLVEGSIGSGEGLLSLIRYDAGGSSLDNWEGLALHIEGGTATVSLGDRSETFTNNGTSFVAEQGNGATLTGGGSYYSYRNARGTEIVFASPSPTVSCGAGACDLPALSIREPSGKTVSLSWEVEGGSRRLLEVSNNLGYAMSVAYQPSEIVNGQVTEAWFDRASVTFRNVVVPEAPTPVVTYASGGVGVTKITDTGGRVWRIRTDAEGRITGIRRPGAPDDNDTTSVAYGGNGVSEVRHAGVTTTYERTVNGDFITTVVSDVIGRRRTVISDAAKQRPTQVVDALNRSTLYEYDGNERLQKIVAPGMNEVITSYDARGNVIETRVKARPAAPGEAALGDIVTTAGFAIDCANALTCNQPIWTRDAAGAQTDYTYVEATGQLASVTAPAPVANGTRPQTRYAYEPLLAPRPTFEFSHIKMLTNVSVCQTGASCVGTPDEVRTKLQYISTNLNPTVVETGAGDDTLVARTVLGHDGIGNMNYVDGPLTDAVDTTAIFYNASREVIGVIGPDPDGTPGQGFPSGPLKHRAQLLIRNADGDIVETYTGTAAGQTRANLDTMSALEAVHTIYENRRPVYQSHDSGGVVTSASQISYDERGRVDCVTQRMDPAEYQSLPPGACYLGSTTGPHGFSRLTKTLYDAADRPAQRIVAVGTGNQSDEVIATWTPNGQVETLTDAHGNKTSYVYDGHDRLSRTFYPVPAAGAAASSTSDYEELAYDARSRVVSQRLRDGKTIGLTYDVLGRLTAKDVPNDEGHWETDGRYAYDNLGRLINASSGMDQSISFGYDALGRKTSEANSYYGTTTSAYDLAGRRTRLTHQDGFSIAYDYLVTGEMNAITESAGGAMLATFAYDDRGRRTSLTRGNGAVTTYAYDLGARLRSLVHDLAGTSHDQAMTFGYNPASQIVETGRSNNLYAFTPAAVDLLSTVNGLNQVTSVGGSTLTHDARGNLVRRETKPGSFDTYGYTAENRLSGKGYERRDGDMITGGTTTRLAYDPLGRLFHLNGSASDFLYDGVEVIGERQAYGGGLRKRFVHGPGVDEPLVVYDANGAKRWFHADERGSVVATSDAAGNAATVHRYDEYGIPQDALGDRFGYTGQMWLPEAGVYSYKARMYDPTLGRFLQSDPIGYAAGMNLYAYVKADPVNFIDPTGTEIVVRGTPAPWCDRTRNIGSAFCAALRNVVNSVHENEHGGGAGGAPGTPATPGKRTGRCRGGYISVTRSGSDVSISGKLTFIPAAPFFGKGVPTAVGGSVSLSAQNFYVGAINSRWTGSFGRYNVNTNLVAGLGGLPTYVSPAGSNGYGITDGSFMQFADNRAYPVPAGNLAAHEFGHGGLSLPHVDPGRGLMQPNAQGRPTEQNVADALVNCGAD